MMPDIDCAVCSERFEYIYSGSSGSLIFCYYNNNSSSNTIIVMSSSKESASQIQRAESVSTPGSGVAEGGRAATAQSVAGRTVSNRHSEEARGHGGVVDKGGPTATAQSQAAHTKMFPKIW